MRAHLGNIGQRAAGQAHQGDAHAHENLVDDVKPRLRQQAVNIGHPPIGRIFNRQHRHIGPAIAHGIDDLFECIAGQGLHIGARQGAGLVAIGTQNPLKSDAIGLCHVKSIEKWPRWAFGRGKYTLRRARGSI